jgi:alkyl hydroperoxide reductase subunit AhpC
LALNFSFPFSWCVLFSHPADFTPVCTTELGRIAVHMPEFVKRDVKILAHSVDPLNSHVDWVNVGVFFFNPKLVDDSLL